MHNASDGVGERTAAEEQRHLDLCYELLDGQREALAGRVAAVLAADSTGTAQDDLERQALLDSLAAQSEAVRLAEARLVFGRVAFEDGADHRIGRIGLRDRDGDPVLLDWRAPNAAPFYQATAAHPQGVRWRRRIMTSGRRVAHTEDEDLADPTLDGLSAARASVERPRSGRMADIVATIAADQDAIIRSPTQQITVVQGGPGTGKTVVALHRAAWLLYTHRDRLARDGVLVIGPSPAFLHYIGQVLPSLGETDVVLLTPGELYPPVSTELRDAPEIAQVKGDLRMVQVIERAVRARIRTPAKGLDVVLEDGTRLRLAPQDLAEARNAAPRGASFHAGREPFLTAVLERLARLLAEQCGKDPADADDRALMLADLVDDRNVRRELNLMWLPIEPTRLVALLLSDAPTLAAAADGILSKEEQQTLLRAQDAPWTVDDVPLLEEAAERLGPTPTAAAEEQTHRRTLAERAVVDREWVYGHVVVDEAQDLSLMAWHAIARRATRGSMTVVGDLHQAAHPAAPSSWDEALAGIRGRREVRTLAVSYRITRQIAEAAAAELVRAGGDAPELNPIRDGAPVERQDAALEDLPNLLEVLTGAAEGRAAVIAPDALIPALRDLLPSDRYGHGASALDHPVAVLTAQQSKGLEFDVAVVLDPGALGRQARRGADVYVACTRATQRLHLVDLP